MRIVAFGGRFLLSAIFLLSGIAKLTNDDAGRDGSTTKVVTAKMNCFLESVERVSPMPLPLDVVQALYLSHTLRTRTHAFLTF